MTADGGNPSMAKIKTFVLISQSGLAGDQTAVWPSPLVLLTLEAGADYAPQMAGRQQQGSLRHRRGQGACEGPTEEEADRTARQQASLLVFKIPESKV